MFIRSDWSDIKELASSPSQQMRKILNCESNVFQFRKGGIGKSRKPNIAVFNLTGFIHFWCMENLHGKIALL